MATMDHWFLELQLSKFNINALIMQLEQFFGKSLLFSICPYLKLMFSKVIKKFINDQLTYSRSNTNLKSHFLRYFHIAKKLLDRFFHSSSNVGLGTVQLKYQSAEPLKFSFLRFRTLNMGHLYGTFLHFE